MKRTIGLLGILLLGAAPAPGAPAGGIAVELWTDRGSDAVYQPGEAIELGVRCAEEGYLLLYELDAEGRVRVLWPPRGSAGFLEAGRTLTLPADHAEVELVVEGPAGQGYVVAIVSREPFADLPWYLRPYDLQGEELGYEELGYVGGPEDEEGVTAEGRIVGDPFVAMERMRRRVLVDPEDPDAFGTAYASYFVGHRVRYPRYLCYDCHRPHRWAWWDGFDPYYATCRVFDFRVNWGWYWGPRFWFGTVPYYYFVYRHDCPPRYRLHSTRYRYHSSWDGWRRWTSLWGGSLRRYKSPPPPDYVPPSKYRDRWPKERPPGLLSERAVGRGRHEGGLRSASGPSRERGPAGERERAWRGGGPRPPGGPPGGGQDRRGERDLEPRDTERGMADRRANPLREVRRADRPREAPRIGRPRADGRAPILEERRLGRMGSGERRGPERLLPPQRVERRELQPRRDPPRPDRRFVERGRDDLGRVERRDRRVRGGGAAAGEGRHDRGNEAGRTRFRR